MKLYILIWKYICQYKYTAIVFIIFTLIFAGIFSLYNLETEAVLYAAILCLFISSVLIIFHFYNFCKQHKKRHMILSNILIMTENLPEPKTLAESDYLEMIEKLRNINLANVTKYTNERSESIDYYTTWVHQIKTPVSVMSMILQNKDTNEYRQLSSELFRIEQYIDMILCYFRLDSSSSDFVFKQYNLDKIIRNTIRKFASQFISKRIKLQYEPTDIFVLTDEKWLSFIIEQILSNAVKYTESGKITITVKDEILQISDTGIGIAQEDLPRIFEKNFTGYNGRANKKSTGLGLYLSKKAADKLSIRISAESTIGKGSIFYIDLHSDKLKIE